MTFIQCKVSPPFAHILIFGTILEIQNQISPCKQKAPSENCTAWRMYRQIWFRAKLQRRSTNNLRTNIKDAEISTTHTAMAVHIPRVNGLRKLSHAKYRESGRLMYTNSLKPQQLQPLTRDKVLRNATPCILVDI